MEAATATLDISEFVEIRPMNDWMREASSHPVPKQLFDDLWREGELAILFGDAGKGKSALAVQIGESIARGRPMYPFGMTAKPRDVLLLDFEMSEKQIEMRYAADHDSSKGDALKKKYSFSKRFRRMVIKPEVLYRNDGRPIEEVLRELLQPLILETGAKVLIIDNITHMKRTAESYRETVPLMKELQRLRRRFGLSILVIAHTRKRDARRGLVINDLQSAGMMSKGVDNIFAIGQSRRDSAERYIKHLKPRNAEVLYDGSHVPVFKLEKIGGNFLGFAFTEFSSEKAMLAEPKDGTDWPLIDRIKRMHDEGMSIRAIADRLGRSKTSVHRYLQMWHPQSDPEYVPESRSHRAHDPKANPHYFPGREEYTAETEALLEQEAEYDLYDEEPDIQYDLLTRAAWIVENATADARREYEKTGVAPRLADNEEYRAFKEAVHLYEESGGEIVEEPIEYIVRSFFPTDPEGDPEGDTLIGEWQGPKAAPFMYDSSPHAKAWHRHLVKIHSDRSEAEILKDYRLGEPWCRPPGSIPPLDPDDPFAGMRTEFDANGSLIYVEHSFDDGNPRVWYKYEHGTLHRFERDTTGITRSRPNPNLFGRFVKRE